VVFVVGKHDVKQFMSMLDRIVAEMPFYYSFGLHWATLTQSTREVVPVGSQRIECLNRSIKIRFCVIHEKGTEIDTISR
jgi:hypothetical protein